MINRYAKIYLYERMTELYKCEYGFKKEIGGTTHEILLDCVDLRKIWEFYEQYLVDESIWNKLQEDYGLKDFKKCEDVIDDISHRYKKHCSNGGDHEFSLDEAIEENSKKINELVNQMKGAV